MKVMSYNPAEIMREIEDRAAWIEYRAASRKNHDTTLEEFRAMTAEQKRVSLECAAAVEKCLAKRYGRA